MPAVIDLLSTPPSHAVRLTGLVKTYAGFDGRPPKTALRGLDLAIPRGSIFGLLGPNGAGKSTLINIMAGLVNKSAGEVVLWGFDIDHMPRAARSVIGVVPQELNIDPFFTPRELLDLQAGLYGVPKAERITDELLRTVGLTDKADAYARTLSGGMRRRLMVAKAMVHRPPILVLDEPTAGVDVDLRHQLWANMRALGRAGTTILLTTHYLQEAEDLCDTVAIINDGELVACGRTEALLRQLDSKTLTLTIDRDLTPADLTPELTALGILLASPRQLVVHYRPSTADVGAVLECVRAANLGVIDISTEESHLEDLFLRLTRAGPAEPHP